MQFKDNSGIKVIPSFGQPRVEQYITKNIKNTSDIEIILNAKSIIYLRFSSQ